MKKIKTTPTKKNKKSGGKKHPLLVQILLGILAAGVLTVCIVATAVIANIVSFANGETAIDLDDYRDNQNQTTIIMAYDKNNNPYEYERLHGAENRIWVDLSNMSPYMYDVAVAMEDKRFETHHGVDWRRTASSAVYSALSVVTNKVKTQGGSTITQQLIKNLTDSREVTLIRKYNEIRYALNLEKNFNKSEIMEAYLNTIYLGESCYGVKTAAEKYFGKDIKDLNMAECASLLAITQSPYALDPLIFPEDNKARQEYCLGMLLETGKITQEEYEEAKSYKLVYTNSPDYVPSEDIKKKPAQEEKLYDFYTEYIIDSLIADFQNKLGYSKKKATDLVFYGGLRVYAAVDPDMQAIVTRVYSNRETFAKEENTPEHPAAQSAMVVMDYAGRVCAMAGEAGPKSGNRGTNRATDTTRSPGSSIKPLSIYTPAIEYGLINWSSQIPDAQIYYEGKKMPFNYGGGSGSGQNISVQSALAKSLNTVPVRILQDLTFSRSYQYLSEKFHISTLNGKNDLNYSPLAMGGMYNGAKVIDMAAAYAAFGNGGKYYTPYCYYEVKDKSGNTLLKNDSTAERAMSEETANIMCEMLQTVVTAPEGTVRAYGIKGFPTMAKSGTTTDDWDRWVCGGTPYYCSVVWYGYDQPKRVTGVYGNPAGNIFKKVLDEVHAGLPAKAFPKSANVVEKKYCTESGELAGENCTSTRIGWYNKKFLPGECKLHSNGGAAAQEPSSETAD